MDTSWITAGIRVTTPQGSGVVKYVRMKPPTYSMPVAVSVALDSRKEDWKYSGTMFAAKEIKPE